MAAPGKRPRLRDTGEGVLSLGANATKGMDVEQGLKST